jgi:hypothetical protein
MAENVISWTYGIAGPATGGQGKRLYSDTTVNKLAIFLFLVFLVLCAILWNVELYALMLPVLVVTLFALRQPEYFTLFMFVLTMTISYPSYTLLSFPLLGSGFSVIELAAVGFILLAIFARKSHRKPLILRTALGKTVTLYLGWLVFVLVWQVIVRGNTSVNAVRGYYIQLLFFPIAAMLENDRQWLIVFKGLFILAVISGFVSLLIYFRIGDLGTWSALTGSFRIDEFAVPGYVGPARVLLGGVQLSYALFFVAFLQLGSSEGRHNRYLLFMAFAALIIYISYTRAFVFTLVLGILLILVYALLSKTPFVKRSRAISLFLILSGALAIAGALKVFDLDVAFKRYLVFEQVENISDLETADSMEGRRLENLYALQSILQDPVFGGGFGQSFLVDERLAASAVPQNAFVSLMYLFGIPSLLLWLAVSIAYVATSFSILRRWRLLPAVHRPWLLGFVITFVCLSIASFTAQFVTMKSATLVALMLAYSQYLHLKTAGGSGPTSV